MQEKIKKKRTKKYFFAFIISKFFDVLRVIKMSCTVGKTLLNTNSGDIRNKILKNMCTRFKDNHRA